MLGGMCQRGAGRGNGQPARGQALRAQIRPGALFGGGRYWMTARAEGAREGSR